MTSPDIRAAVDYSAGAALARARALMTILDREHDTATLYARMHAVRHELDTLHDLFPVIGLPQLPMPTVTDYVAPPVRKPGTDQDVLPW